MERDTGRPGYPEALRIGWSLLWKTVGSFLVLLFLANLMLLGMMPELTRTGPSLVALLLPLLLATLVATFLVMPWVARAMLTKRFTGFRLVFVKEHGTPTHVHSTEH